MPMSDDGRNKKTVPGSTTYSFSPGTAVQKGDLISNASSPNGYHVVLKYHVLGTKPYPVGYSDDFVHWSYGQS